MIILDSNSVKYLNLPSRLYSPSTPSVTVDPTGYTVEGQLIPNSMDNADPNEWTAITWHPTPFYQRGFKGDVYAAVMPVGDTGFELTAGETYRPAVRISAGSESIIIIYSSFEITVI